MHTTTCPTPAGPLTAIVDGDTVVAAGFTADADALAARLGLGHAPPVRTGGPVAAAAAAYTAGELDALARVPVRQPGTPFQQLVWAALSDIPPGHPVTYGSLAVAIGRPGATRAVGSACGRNRIAPFVPCHRAVRADGSAGGYLYGTDAKDRLLAHERAHARRLPVQAGG